MRKPNTLSEQIYGIHTEDWHMDKINISCWMLCQEDAGGDIPLAIDFGPNGQNNLKYQAENDYDPMYAYSIRKISPSEFIKNLEPLGYSVTDTLIEMLVDISERQGKSEQLTK